MENGNLAHDMSTLDNSIDMLHQAELNDDQYLEQMRGIMKAYVMAYKADRLTPVFKQESQHEFEALRRQLSDPMLKEYSSFEFMEKLYMQEYDIHS